MYCLLKVLKVSLTYYTNSHSLQAGFTFAESSASVRMEGLHSVVNLITQLAPALKSALQIPAVTSVSTQACDLALVDVCTTKWLIKQLNG